MKRHKATLFYWVIGGLISLWIATMVGSQTYFLLKAVASFLLALFLAKAAFLRFPRIATPQWDIMIEKWNLYVGIVALLISVLPVQAEYLLDILNKSDNLIDTIQKRIDRLDDRWCNFESENQDIEEIMTEHGFWWEEDVSTNKNFGDALSKLSTKHQQCFWLLQMNFAYVPGVKNQNGRVSSADSTTIRSSFSRLVSLTTGRSKKSVSRLERVVEKLIEHRNASSPLLVSVMQSAALILAPLGTYLLCVAGAVKIAHLGSKEIHKGSYPKTLKNLSN